MAAFSPLLDMLTEVPDPRRAEGKFCQRILADRHHEPTRKAGRRSAAKCQTKMMDDMIERRR